MSQRSRRLNFERFVRCCHILAIAARLGLAALWWVLPGRRGSPTRSEVFASSLRAGLERGGVTLVKLGQMLSTQGGKLPPEVLVELAKLRDQVAPVSPEQLARVLRDELGDDQDDLFASFDPTPVAAASVAQVHHARLTSGVEVAVKVQRPGLPEEIALDLYIMARVAQAVEWLSEWARVLALVELVSGFATSLRQELDFQLEAANLRSAGEGAAGRGEDALIAIPGVYQGLCTRRVLVMDWLEGVPLSDAPQAISGSDINPEKLGHDLLVFLLRQILIDGAFHADPHPGNVLLMTDGRLGLLDFGSVGTISLEIRIALRSLMGSVERWDVDEAMDAFLMLLATPPELDKAELKVAFEAFMDRYLASGIAPRMQLFTALVKLVTTYQLTVSKEVATVFRVLATLDGTLGVLAPGFDMVAEVRSLSTADVLRVPRALEVGE